MIIIEIRIVKYKIKNVYYTDKYHNIILIIRIMIMSVSTMTIVIVMRITNIRNK